MDVRNRYHFAGGVLVDHSREIGRADIAAMSAADKRNIIFDGARSRFTIGFEIEKSNINGLTGSDLEFPLFACTERDGSLPYNGGEGVTNILPLVGKSLLRTKVRNEIIAARPFLDLPVDYTCGGHVTIRVDGMTSDELMEACKPFVGLLYSLYKSRLTNQYCRGDLFFTGNDVADGLRVGSPSKYRICKKRGNGMIEFRFPTSFKSVEALLCRYDLFYVLCDCAANGKTPASFRKAIKPILMRMYGNDAAKVADVLRLASRFNMMITSRTINESVRSYVDPCGDLASHYTDSARAGQRAEQRQRTRRVI